MTTPIIIVTGVSRGIGRAIAEEIQSRGSTVVGAARNVADVPATANLLPVAADNAQRSTNMTPLQARFDILIDLHLKFAPSSPTARS